MIRILQIDTSPQGEKSVSRQLTAAIVDHLCTQQTDAKVTYRDLVAAPIPHLGPELLQLLRPTPGSEPVLSAAVREDFALTEALLTDLLTADVVVIGAPMVNFSIPSQLKAWIDRVVQAGRTFKYADGKSTGLLGNKQVIIVSSRGGIYYGTAYETALDFQESYLRAMLGFLGVTDLTYVRAEGMDLGPEKRRAALAAATDAIASIKVNSAAAA